MSRLNKFKEANLGRLKMSVSEALFDLDKRLSRVETFLTVMTGILFFSAIFSGLAFIRTMH